MDYNRPSITQLVFTETGTYQDVVRRSYETNVSGDTIDRIASVTRGGTSISPESLGGVAGHIIRPSMDFTQVGIDNGWNERRFRFSALLSLGKSGHTGQILQWVSGYTNAAAATMSGSIDPDMVLYFNDSITLAQTTEPVPGLGMQTRTRVVDASHILTATRPQFTLDDADVSLRPEDVFSSMQNRHRFGDTMNDVYDERSIIVAPTKSRRTNGRQADWLSRTLSAFSNRALSPEGGDGDFEDMVNSARGTVREADIYSDRFFNSLMRLTSYKQEMSITYGELCSVFDVHEEAVDLIWQGGVSRARPASDHREEQEGWNGGGVETMIATILSQSIPGIITSCMLTGIEFMASNRVSADLGSPYDIKVTNSRTVTEGMDQSPSIRRFIDLLMVEVLPGLTNNNHIDLEVYMYCDIFEDLRIEVSVAGGPITPFINPTYCDRLSAPIVSATGREGLEHLSSDLSDLMTEVTSGPNNSSSLIVGSGSSF